ncbi:MAG: hypothetical protein QM774_02275 [Gordonia sp. (in: high G+C Gram-positive bacteria)]|uniref:hypothetical protein n=1 Tax=Gordonia sp. (in: high G+C Gram-positive bacteria) TaxID=84139 RepID=UPI0039E293D6
MRRLVASTAALGLVTAGATACGSHATPVDSDRVVSASRSYPAGSEQARRARLSDLRTFVARRAWAKTSAFYTPRCQAQASVAELARQAEQLYGPTSGRDMAGTHEHTIRIDRDVATVITKADGAWETAPGVHWALVNSL